MVFFPRDWYNFDTSNSVESMKSVFKEAMSPLEPTSLKAVKIYVHCLTHIFQTSRFLRMKSLGECSQLNYGTPQTRIRSNGVQMKELCNLQNRWLALDRGYIKIHSVSLDDHFNPSQFQKCHCLLGSYPTPSYSDPSRFRAYQVVSEPLWLKQRNQRKRQNKFDDDEKWVRSGDRPFTKAKRSNRVVLDQNELQTYASLEKMLHKAIYAIWQLKKKGNTNTSPSPKQQSNFSSLSNSDLETNVFSSNKSKTVKPTSKDHSTRCFKCHRIGHYANKCQKKRPLVTLENENVKTEPEKEDPLPIFDDFTYEPMEGLDEEQICGHQANQEGSSSIQKTDRTQDLRTNLFEEEGNDVPRFVDQSIGAKQYGSSKDICSLFDSYLPNLEASTHEITWRMFSTQLRNSSNQNQIKWSSDERVMQFTKPVIFSSREFGPYGSSNPRLDPYHHGPE
uniref:CCHC-type domain-containing protein n=1 Tax=Brassica oleracea var. oleracea TaxID=109376 RepID=A0A0D3BUE9_BRAOL